MRLRFILLVVFVISWWPGGVTLAADPRPANMLSNTCAGCHGTNGASAGLTMPIIGGLSKQYLSKAMQEFKNGARPSTIMGRIAKGYSDNEIEAIASYFADQQWVPASIRTSATKARKGKKLHAERCEVCHSDNGRINDRGIPRLAGQWPAYLKHQLRDFQDIERTPPQPSMMKSMVDPLSDDELTALAHFYASQQ